VPFRFAFVYFDSAEAKRAAIAEVDGSFWLGRRIQVLERTKTEARRNEREPINAEPSPVLFVGNIPYDATDAELTGIFRELPNIEDIRVAVDRTTGWPRGFAHLTFLSTEAAQEGKSKLDGTEIHGRQLRVNYSTSKKNSTEDSGSSNFGRSNTFGEN